MTRAIFFDRDGVINDLVLREDNKWTAPWTLSELHFKPHIVQTLKAVKQLGFLTFIVTNQPGIIDGDMRLPDLAVINTTIQTKLGIDGIKTALHRDSNDYKPNSGMVESILHEFHIDRFKSFMIGDRWKDVVAGDKENLTTIFVGEDYSTPPEYTSIYPDYTVKDAYEVGKLIVKLADKDCNVCSMDSLRTKSPLIPVVVLNKIMQRY